LPTKEGRKIKKRAMSGSTVLTGSVGKASQKKREEDSGLVKSEEFEPSKKTHAREL